MLPNNHSLGKIRSMLMVIPLIIATLIAYSPSKALGDYENDGYEFGNYDNAIRMMATNWYLKKVMKVGRITILLLFRPQCRYVNGLLDGVLGEQVNTSRNQAKKACKKRGGSKCTLFWSYGKIKYKGLSETGANKLNAVAQRIGQEEIVTEPLIEGDVQSEANQKRFQRNLQRLRNRNSSSNRVRHFAVCGTGYKLWTYSSLGGNRSSLKHVRKMCVLRCRAIVDYHDLGKQCFIFVEDGEFVSSEAERIFME